MKLYLIRHPEMEASVQKRCIGHTDAPAAQVAPEVESSLIQHARAAEPKTLLSSDLQRCLVLAKPLGEALSLPVQTDAQWRDPFFGEWENREWSEIQTNDKERLTAWAKDIASGQPPGGEAFEAFEQRVLAALNATIGLGATVLVVTHPAVVKLILSHASGWRRDRSFHLPAPANAMFQLNHDGAKWSCDLKPINASELVAS